MTFLQLQYVVEINKFSSINKAARNLYVSQSGISMAIKELEKELGITLFTRTNRGVQMTDEGLTFLNYAKSLIDSKEQVESIYKNSVQKGNAYISISSQRYPFAEDAFINLIKRNADGSFHFRITETGIDKVIDNVYNNHSEIGIIFMSDLTEKLISHILSSRGLEFHLIRAIQPSVFVRKGHPLGGKTVLSPDELRGYPYLTFEHNKGQALELSEEVYLLSMSPPNQIIYVNDRATAVNIISNTDALTTGSGLIVESSNDTRMLSIPLNTNDKMKLGWISHERKTLSKNVVDYIEELELSVERALIYTENLRK